MKQKCGYAVEEVSEHSSHAPCPVINQIVIQFHDRPDILDSVALQKKLELPPCHRASHVLSGCGARLSARLASRFWDVDKGAVLLGGIDVKRVDPEKLLEYFSIVFQDVTLFNNTVMENIRIGKQGATDEEVMQAAKEAQCDEFIQKLPASYETEIGENGYLLSGGERQRISIARALLKDAPVILLDEGTASLDAENETLIQNAILRLIKNKTVLIIAHRMRTVAGADKLVVIDGGKIAEQGSPAELIKQNGIYKRMTELQSQSAEWKM